METRAPDRARLGALAGLVGAALALVGMGLRPMFLGLDTRGVLEEIAGHGTWTELHLLLSVAVVLVAVGLVALAETLGDRERREEVGFTRPARSVALVGAPVATAAMLIDAVARQPTAQAWADASPDDREAAFLVAEAVDLLWYATFTGWVLLLLGVAPALLGLAQWRSGDARWLAGAGIAGGVGGALVGGALVLTRGSDVLYLALGAISMIVLAWLAVTSARALWERVPGSGGGSRWRSAPGRA